MTDERFEIRFAAQTASCTFLLDGLGICRKVVVAPERRGRRGARAAAQCVGAQYVASVDPNASGCLIDAPRVGRPMLLARIDASGRISLVRTGAIMSFEIVERDAYHTTSDGVSTSAPEIGTQSTDYPTLGARTQRNHVVVPSRDSSIEDVSSNREGPDSVAPESMRPERLRASLPPPSLGGSEELDSSELEDLADSGEMTTAEWRSASDDLDEPVSEQPHRHTIPWGVPCSQPPTLRRPATDEEFDENPYAARRLSRSHRAYGNAAEDTADYAFQANDVAPVDESDVQLSRRRR